MPRAELSHLIPTIRLTHQGTGTRASFKHNQEQYISELKCSKSFVSLAPA